MHFRTTNCEKMLTLSIIFLSLYTLISSEETCVIDSYESVEATLTSCKGDITLSSFEVPFGKTLEIKLKDYSNLIINGTVTFGVSEEEWQGPLMKVTGKGIKVTGTKDSLLSGQGTGYWDGNGEETKVLPKFLWIQATQGSTFTGINMKNCPYYCVFIKDSSDLTLKGFHIDNKDGNIYMPPYGSWARNTDGFDIETSINIEISDSIVYNQDDCVAARMGHSMTFRNLYCHGGHGLSVSVGWSKIDVEMNTLRNVTFENCTVVESENGIHVKTHVDAGDGELNTLVYRDVRMEEITKRGIYIQQDYSGGHGTGDPKGNIPIKHLIFENIEGTINSNAMGVQIICAERACANWSWTNINITGQKGDSCNYMPHGYDCY